MKKSLTNLQIFEQLSKLPEEKQGDFLMQTMQQQLNDGFSMEDIKKGEQEYYEFLILKLRIHFDSIFEDYCRVLNKLPIFDDRQIIIIKKLFRKDHDFVVKKLIEIFRQNIELQGQLIDMKSRLATPHTT